VLVQNPMLQDGFMNELKKNEARRVTGDEMYNPANPDEFEAEKAAVWHVLKSKMQFRRLLNLEKSSVLLTFHGCSHEAAQGICNTGHATGVNTSANGLFFGHGHYTTTSAEYACLYARNSADGGLVEPAHPRNANPQGEHVVVAQYANIERCYVGTRSRDYTAHGANLDSMCYLNPEALIARANAFNNGSITADYERNVVNGHDSRFFIVNQQMNFEAVNLTRGTLRARDERQPASYDELVVNKDTQLLPFALFYFKAPAPH